MSVKLLKMYRFMCSACWSRDKHMLAPSTADASLSKYIFLSLSNSSWSLFLIQRTQNMNNNITFHPSLKWKQLHRMNTWLYIYFYFPFIGKCLFNVTFHKNYKPRRFGRLFKFRVLRLKVSASSVILCNLFYRVCNAIYCSMCLCNICCQIKFCLGEGREVSLANRQRSVCKFKNCIQVMCL